MVSKPDEKVIVTNGDVTCEIDPVDFEAFKSIGFKEVGRKKVESDEEEAEAVPAQKRKKKQSQTKTAEEAQKTKIPLADK